MARAARRQGKPDAIANEGFVRRGRQAHACDGDQRVPRPPGSPARVCAAAAGSGPVPVHRDGSAASVCVLGTWRLLRARREGDTGRLSGLPLPARAPGALRIKGPRGGHGQRSSTCQLGPATGLDAERPNPGDDSTSWLWPEPSSQPRWQRRSRGHLDTEPKPFRCGDGSAGPAAAHVSIPPRSSGF